MQDKELSKLHNALLFIMDEIDRICSENNLKYSLTGGSLIGAVRHKGFIPWDDDMDIAMLREDYEKFRVICQNKLKPEFMWQDSECDKDYPYSFGKVVLNNTQYKSLHHENETWQKGIYVDVFPLDNVPNSKLERNIQGYKNFLLIKMLECKTGIDVSKKSNAKIISFLILQVVCRLFSFTFLVKVLHKNITKYRYVNSPRVCNFGGYYGFKKETTYKAYFMDVIRVPFKDREYNIISRYDEFLTSVYGNYMELPPIEKRHTHEVAVLDFGPYVDYFCDN